jgi:sugar phosphate isomerase/epimerase
LNRGLVIATDYLHDRNPVHESLQAAADAGFTGVHWCQHWNDDYIYSASEIKTIRSWLKEAGLKCPDLHATAGNEKAWGSTDPYAARAGLELLENRMEMTAALGGDAVVLHPRMSFVKGKFDNKGTIQKDRVQAMTDALPDLVKLVDRTGIKIALENMPFTPDVSDILDRFLEAAPAKKIGVCYDAGHGNIVKGSLDWLRRWKDRLFVVHLHDNKGRIDQHLIPFEGTTDWPKVMEVIASSSYKKALTLELWRWTRPKLSLAGFLNSAHQAGMRLQELLERA